jgi:HSP20 family protein
MTLVRSLPARPVYSPQSEITRLFNSLFDSATPLATAFSQSTRNFVPAIDVVEHDGEFLLNADLPGLSEGDVKVEILDGVMTISGERKLEREETGDGYRRIERASGSFERKLALPKGIEADAVKASFVNGVLEVHVPKPAESKPQLVEIATAA